MTEYAYGSNEELASAFIVDTCQLNPRSSLSHSDHMHNVLSSDSPLPTVYAIVCGSNAEFYIRPLITCIDDVDILTANTDFLVFSGDFPVLPSDISCLPDTIRCLKIEPYDRYPGFVRLRHWGEMVYSWKYKEYEFNYAADKTNIDDYYVLDLDGLAETYALRTFKRGPSPKSGPAVKHRMDGPVDWFYSGCDLVESRWCPQWPKEAQGWINRPRNSGWPTTDIISEVVQNGCYVVYVQHPSCRNDKLQWRLSFAFAEVTLLQSWTQTQQIVYHLLRFFAKRELIQKECPKEDEVLCTYHLKTLMLWTCEEMPAEWWYSSSVIVICCELLKKLSNWLKTRIYRNYFIPEANLYHEPSSPAEHEMIERRLTEFCNPEILCDWFVDNYILFFIRRHFEPIETLPHFVGYTLAVFAFWKTNQLKYLDLYLYLTFDYSTATIRFAIKCGFNSGLRFFLTTAYWDHKLRSLEMVTPFRLNDLPTVLCFTYYDILINVLNIAYSLSCGDISLDGSLFVEFVNTISMQPKIVRSQYHNLNFPKTFTSQSSDFNFWRAQKLMVNLAGSKSRSEFHLLSLMSKHFLEKALKQDGTIYMHNEITPAALAYLAALYFATSEYQEATDLCSTFLMDHQTSQEDKETLHAGCLLFIDDIARIVGLCVLQKKITEQNLHYHNIRLYLDLRLSSEVFARCLTVLSAEQMSKQPCFCNDLTLSLFPIDANLMTLIRAKILPTKSRAHCNDTRQILCRREDSLTETEASSENPKTSKEIVIDALMEYALENMASFYNAIRKVSDISYCNTADCYRALYLYKCRQYDAVLHLCAEILKDPDLKKDLKELSLTNVLLLPPLDSFFDRDVQSLLGFHTLFFFLSPLNDDLGNIELTDESTFQHWFASGVYRDKSNLFQFIKSPYSIKCNYFLGRHFIARYLKLRCCIDCNLPFSEAFNESALQKPRLPFEQIISRFLLRRLRV